MTTYELKSIKSIAEAATKSLQEVDKKMSKSVSAIPNIEPRIDPKIEILSDIEHNTTYPFWKNLLISVIGGMVGGVISFLLTLLFI